MTLRIFSYGGGVQSTAALVLACRGDVDYPTFLFANVGDDAEHPDTLRYVREVAVPYGADHGVKVLEIAKVRRDGTPAPTLYQALMAGGRSIPIPVRLGPTGGPGRRTCTRDYKIKVVERWLRLHGVRPDDPATVGIGISTDEIERAKPGVDPRAVRQRKTYPLLDLGLDRNACARLIADEGLPVPGKSACWFCPYHRPSAWRERKRDEPALFARAVELERTLTAQGVEIGRSDVYLTGAGMPLDEAISPDGDQLGFDLDGDDCESGFCMT